MIKVGIVSLGCPKNLVDTEVMLGTLQRRGFAITGDPTQADVIVVNTCTFIDPARRESIDTILEMAELRTRGPCRRLVVAGCMVQRNRDELAEAIPEIDALVGLDDVERIAEACALTSTGAGFEASSGAARYLYSHETPRLLSTPRHSTYLKISEGCDHTCSFCPIPSFRGVQRSRTISSVVAEAAQLAATGTVEINVIAQDTTDYGSDLGDGTNIAALLRALNSVEGLEWIRVLYAYPNRITPEFMDAMSDCDRVARYLDMPLQHTDAALLRTMRRGGSGEAHLRLLETLRARVPGISVRTTFIVGFPGETDAQFESLCRFVEEAGFDHAGAFTYSEEQGTPAAALADDIPQDVKEARRARLLEIQERQAARRNGSLIGQEVRVLVEGTHEESDLLICGRTEGQAPEIDGRVILTDAPRALNAGDFVTARIQEVHGYDLYGAALDREPDGSRP
jgi:ribosomal protein S12 methylthiotransferase